MVVLRVKQFLCNRLYVNEQDLHRMPKSVLRYDLDKGQYFDLETSSTQSCFPNKETDSQWRVKQFILCFLLWNTRETGNIYPWTFYFSIDVIHFWTI